MSALGFSLVLVALDDDLGDAWRRHCDDVEGVSVVVGDIFATGADAVVSPANSLGLMGGGIDGLYRRRFGAGLETTLQAVIAERHDGELPVGAAVTVPTGDEPIRFVIAAPTMRRPGTRLTDATNAHAAAAAVIAEVRAGVIASGPRAGEAVADHVAVVAMPGLGTGVGGLEADACARAVREALDAAVSG